MCSCEDQAGDGDFLDEWMNGGGGGVSVTLTDAGGETEGRIRLSWAAVLGILALVLIVASVAQDA